LQRRTILIVIPDATGYHDTHKILAPSSSLAAAVEVTEAVETAATDPTIWSAVIAVAIASVAYSFINPDSSENIRELVADQIERANDGPLIVDYEPIELIPKYGITSTNETKKEEDYIVSQKEEVVEPPKTETASDKIRDFWEHDIVEQANQAPAIRSVTTASKKPSGVTPPADSVSTALSDGLPVIPEEASAEELTSLLSSVADTVKRGKDIEALIAQKLRAAEFEEPMSDKVVKQVRQQKSKRRWVVRAAKKIVMPWRKWKQL